MYVSDGTSCMNRMRTRARYENINEDVDINRFGICSDICFWPGGRPISIHRPASVRLGEGGEVYKEETGQSLK